MKKETLIKEIITAAVILLLIAVPTYAEKNNGNGKSEARIQSNVQEESDEVVNPSISPNLTVTPSASPSITIKREEKEDADEDLCDPEASWKNHGAFVSCVAHEHLGGKETSEAAKSDIGKHEDNDEITPSVSPSITPPISSAAITLTGGTSPLSEIQTLFSRFIDFLKGLI